MGSTFPDIVLIVGLSVPFVLLCLRLKVLTLGGGAMAGCIALAVVVAQGWLWLVPLFVFLISGVLLGRLNKNIRSDAKHGRPRDAFQVFCSGGLYALLAVLDDFHCDLCMSISICVALCDTWASEIGMYCRWSTVSIATWRRVPHGLSGGVSLAGTLGGLLGAVILANVLWSMNAPNGSFDGFFLTAVNVTLYCWHMLVLVGFAMGGMFLDSVLGSLFQATFDDGTGPSDSGTRQVAGFRWMTNDLVNLISNALTVGLAMLWL